MPTLTELAISALHRYTRKSWKNACERANQPPSFPSGVDPTACLDIKTESCFRKDDTVLCRPFFMPQKKSVRLKQGGKIALCSAHPSLAQPNSESNKKKRGKDERPCLPADPAKADQAQILRP